MRDFALAISGVLVGGLITLGGTFLQAKLSADKEGKAELRTKLELLLQAHHADLGCHMYFLSDGEYPTRCDEGQFGWRAMALSNIYFPDLTPALAAFNDASAKGRAARQQCDIDHPQSPRTVAHTKCVQQVLKSTTVSAEVGEIAVEASKQATRLRLE